MKTRQSRPKKEHLSFDKKISGKPKTEDCNKLFGLVMKGGREDLQGFGLNSELFSIFLSDLKKGIVQWQAIIGIGLWLTVRSGRGMLKHSLTG